MTVAAVNPGPAAAKRARYGSMSRDRRWALEERVRPTARGARRGGGR